MTYLIGAILIVLLIALVLVFRPPRQKPQEDVSQLETAGDLSSAADDQLDLDIAYGRNKADSSSEEELELALDETDDFQQADTGTHEKEGFQQPSAVGKDVADDIEELNPELIEDEEETQQKAGPKDTEEIGSDEFDEDIPFIEDDGETFKRKVEMTPALADIPDDFVKTVDEDMPDELAERLEYFLGTDDEETEELAGETGAEQVDDTQAKEGAPDETENTAAAEKEEAVEAELGIDSDKFSSYLQKQVDRLHNELNEAIEKRETVKIGYLGAALENLCVKQADVTGSFQTFQQLREEFESVLSELTLALPGFQHETVQASLRKGEFEIVCTMITEAVRQLENSPQLAAAVLYHYGRIEEERGDFAAAFELFYKASGADEENLNSLSAAGRLARIIGDSEKALPMLNKRVSAGQEKGEESIDLARSEHELARALIMADDEKEKIQELLTRALASMEKILGPDHHELGPVLHDLAVFHDSSGRYEQAEPLYKRALEVVEQGMGSDSPRLAATLNKLAGLYEEIEMEEKSEPLYTKALEIRRKVLGENHPDVGSILGHLANLLKLKGKYEEAEPMYRKSLGIAEAAMGKDHPNLAVVLNDMAELYSEMGNEKQAEHFQERAFSLFGLPGMEDGFVEMEKDTGHDGEDDTDQTIAGR